MRLHPAPLVAAALTLALASPNTKAQDDHAPPAELDPGQVILPHNPDREVERIALEVGRATTYFDGPLREDGTVDYIAALNARYSEGVTLENNAYAELVLLMPAARRSENDADVMAMLGLPRERVDEDACFITWESYAIDQDIPDHNDANYFLTEDNWVTDAGMMWLEANEAALDRLAAAVDRSRYWAPMVAGENAEDNMIMVYLPQLGTFREYARALQARIYIRATDGDGQGAVRDLITIRRLAAKVRYEPTLISGLVGISLDAMVFKTIEVLLNTQELDADALTLLAASWDDRDEIIPLAELVDHGERSMGLDLLQQLWSGRIGEDETGWFDLGFAGSRYQSRRFNINRGLRTLSRHYNTEVRIMRVQSYAQWKPQHDAWEAQWEAEHEVVGQDPLEIAGTIGRALISNDAYTDSLTSLYMGIIMPALGAARRTEYRMEARQAVVWTALQCERYRLASGEVPATLDALVPDYLDTAPVDPIDGRPMGYIVTDAGYIIYSIGTDLEDDGGVHDFSEGDIAVTIELGAE